MILFKIFIPLLFFLLSSGIGQIKTSQNKDVYGVVFLQTMFSNVALNDANAAVNVYLNELQRNFDIGCGLKIVMFENTEDFLKSYSRENLAIISLSSVDYLINKSKLPVSPILVSSLKGSPYEEYLLLTKKDNEINSIKDLRDQKIGMTSRQNNIIPYMWLEVQLAKNKVPSRYKILNKLSEGKVESQNIMAVFFGQLDACIVSKRAFQVMSELNPQVEKQLKILTSSPGYVISVSCFSSKFMQSPYHKNLYDATLKVVSYPAGQQLFALMKIDKVIPYKDEYLDGVKNLIADFNSLHGQNK